MLVLAGKPVAEAHKAALHEKMKAAKAQNEVITLAIIRVGDDEASKMYAHFMEKTATSFGFAVVVRELPATATQEDVETLIDWCNQDDAVYGVLPLMPMPAHIDGQRVLDRLDPRKDIDGLTTHNIGLVSSGKGGFAPCTPRACLAILEHYNIPVQGKHIVVLGRSQVVGRPVALMLLEKHGTVTICHSKTPSLETFLKQADIVVTAVGRAHMVTGDMVKAGAVVIDVGINQLEGRTVGDCDYDSVAAVAGAVTPVPGGVGSVTTTMMLEALYEAYHARNVDCE